MEGCYGNQKPADQSLGAALIFTSDVDAGSDTSGFVFSAGVTEEASKERSLFGKNENIKKETKTSNYDVNILHPDMVAWRLCFTSTAAPQVN